MKRLAISLSIVTALGVSGCDDTTLEDVQSENEELRQEIIEIAYGASVAFDPAAGVVSLPNDLIFVGTNDFTLETPAEADAKEAGEEVDFTDPEASIGALDGWGVQNSFAIAIDYDEGISLDATTITSSDAVAIYQVKSYPIVGDDNCSDSTKALQACEGVVQLTWGVDYVTSLSDGDIIVTPLKPFLAGTNYIVALTNVIKDNQGDPLESSSSYLSLERDIAQYPLVTDEQLQLQAIYNSFENVLARDFGADPDAIVHTASFTTQSAGVAGTDPLQVTKLLNAQAFSSADYLSITSSGYTVGQAFVGAGLIQASDASFTAYNTADVYSGSLTVPYYLETPVTGDPLTGRWEAACDSGVILNTLTSEQLTGLAANAGDNHATCSTLGLADLGLDTERHLTKYNPLPVTKSTETIDVQMTIPNHISMPDSGWPVVILQHGITSKKEDMLAVTGALSSVGYATVAIDHPMHGTRGYEISDGVWVNATNNATEVDGVTDLYPGNSATHYLNLSSLLTARDNLRQSVADTLKLRLSLNAVVDNSDNANPTSVAIDGSQVFYLGHSLGAITGTAFTAIANTPANTGDATTDATVNALYQIKASVLANPGSSIANFLVESKNFSPIIYARVMYAAGNDVSTAIIANIDDISTVIASNLASVNPSDACQALAFGSTDDTHALICAYDEFVNNATDEELEIIKSTMLSFVYAAQAILESGDPSNYSNLLSSLQTPVLLFEVVGDGVNQSDLVIPNTLLRDPGLSLGGTTGLANQLGLTQISDTTVDTSAISGIIRFNAGSHSSLLSPTVPDYLKEVDEATYTTKFAAVTSEMQIMTATFFYSGSLSVPISDTAKATCIINNYVSDICLED